MLRLLQLNELITVLRTYQLETRKNRVCEPGDVMMSD